MAHIATSLGTGLVKSESKSIEWLEQYDEKVKGYGLFMLNEVYYMNQARREGWFPFHTEGDGFS